MPRGRCKTRGPRVPISRSPVACGRQGGACRIRGKVAAVRSRCHPRFRAQHMRPDGSTMPFEVRAFRQWNARLERSQESSARRNLTHGGRRASSRHPKFLSNSTSAALCRYWYGQTLTEADKKSPVTIARTKRASLTHCSPSEKYVKHEPRLRRTVFYRRVERRRSNLKCQRGFVPLERNDI